MFVFKFGGASVKNADAVRNLAAILKNFNAKIVVVISAMGKTTNALEQITELYIKGDKKQLNTDFENLKAYHYYIMHSLFPDKDHEVYKRIKNVFSELTQKFEKKPTLNYDFDYDQIVSRGELLSTIIVEAFLKTKGFKSRWLDIRESVKTSNKFREAKVDWELTESLCKENFHFTNEDLIVTQGFLGSTVNNITTTLGREGSDYSAAIIAYTLEVEKVVIWKDVPGVLNADPKWFDDTVLLEKISYKDAIELAFYGTSVIHPKTIQPLKRKNIPLYVRSFIDPKNEGTHISNLEYDSLIPNFIFKMNQVLIRISARDLSFIAEEYLEIILGSFARQGLNINLMQNSATSFQICVNNDRNRIDRIILDLEDKFQVDWENSLELVTIRYYDQKTIERVTIQKVVILEQRNRTTIQMVMRDKVD